MKRIILITTMLVSSWVLGQDAYTKGMSKAFELWGSQKPVEAANLFERIATAEPDNWLPFYYVSQINTFAAFAEKDKEKHSQLLEKAQQYVDLANAISPKNADILVQQAMVHTAWIASDGATYGMTLSGKVAALYKEASILDPENPRVILSKAEWDMGSAKYFGKDTSPYCKDVERSLELFTNFKPATPFHPSWGKERAEEVLQNCKS